MISPDQPGQALADGELNAGEVERTAVWTGVVAGVRVAVLDDGTRVFDAVDLLRLLDGQPDDAALAALADVNGWCAGADLSKAETLPAPPEEP